MGGTGKTPHIVYIGKLLEKNNLNFATLSRGYGRKTKGFLEVTENSSAENVGDEPLLFKQKFSDKMVAVCEDRVFGATKILNKTLNTTLLLDDAYQHQKIARSLNILLTDYQNLFCADFIFPVGNLRELRKNKSRADVIIVTKCPENLSINEQEKIREKIAPKENQSVYFSSIIYGDLFEIFSKQKKDNDFITNRNIIVVSAIARPKYLFDFITSKNNVIIDNFEYEDHSPYPEEIVEDLFDSYNEHKTLNPIFITTEKDAVKLRRFPQLKTLPLYAITIDINVLNNENAFNNLLIHHVRNH
jgi:tetraacyldisaccharide 4'-kinase